jgi:hypothetical protein
MPDHIASAQATPMGQATVTTTLTIDELAASDSLYGKGLRLLIHEGMTSELIRSSVCWQRLSAWHDSLPRQYMDPCQYFLFKREMAA